MTDAEHMRIAWRPSEPMPAEARRKLVEFYMSPEWDNHVREMMEKLRERNRAEREMGK